MSAGFEAFSGAMPAQQRPPVQSPPVLHPPPQIFGNSQADSSTLPAIFSDPMFALDDWAFMPDDGVSDPKRRRIARACDMCRKKKIKCDGMLPACTHCLNYKTGCVFTHVEKKRSPPKGAKYIESLENRLKRMESVLRVSGLLEEGDNGKTDLATLEKKLARKSARAGPSPSQSNRRPASAARLSSSDSGHDDVSASNSPLASPTRSESPPDLDRRTEKEIEELSDMMCSLVTNNCGETKYIGSSSGFSIFSPKGIQWVNEKTGDTSFEDMISSAVIDDNKWVHWKPEIFGDLFSRRTFKPLPPKNEALSLLKDFFENFNCMFPLFHEPTFMHLVDLQYSPEPHEGSGWWASLNVALAIAHRLRVMSKLVSREEDLKAWAYLKNAMGVVTELTMRNTDLFSVQALLGMALFLQGTPNPQPSFFLVAAAIRLSHGIGLHKRGSGFNLRPVEIEQRKRVFWIAYLVDKDLCLRSGRPPAQDDDDMNVELPSEDPPDNIGNIPLADGKGKVNLFRLMCTFAIIESKVYKQLYSTKALRQSDGELLHTIGELDRELDEWKDTIPLDFRPEHEIQASHTPLILHVVVLHFAYYNCLTTIHRMSVHHGYWSSRLSNYAIQGLNARPLNPRVFSSAALSVAAARASIQLIQYIPQGDYACVWLILYFPVSAMVTLFANIVQNPQDANAHSDLRLMNQVVSFLSTLCDDEENGGVRRMLGICAEFTRIASVVIDKAESESTSRRKRKGCPDVSRTSDRAACSMTPSQAKSTPTSSNPPVTPASSVDREHPARVRFPSYDASPAKSSCPLQALAAPASLPPSVRSASPHANGSWSTDVASSDTPNLLTPPTDVMPGFTEAPSNSFTGASPLNFSAFQQPFLPQDLWQMPMTFEWDWADITSPDAPPLFEAGGSRPL